MIQPSLEIIKQSSEYKAAVALAGIHNAMSFKPEYFAKSICLQHRTLQQSIILGLDEGSDFIFHKLILFWNAKRVIEIFFFKICF